MRNGVKRCFSFLLVALLLLPLALVASLATETKAFETTPMIEAGYYFAVGLNKNGTVVTAGENRFGQRNVSSWTDIIDVSAYSYHTVGVKKDGTVVSVGNNVNGERNISSWMDIVAVSAGSGYTLGLKSDGTVLAVGDTRSGLESVSSWNLNESIILIDNRTFFQKIIDFFMNIYHFIEYLFMYL